MALDISSLAGPATTLIPLVFSLGRLPYVFTDFSALILRGLSPIHQKSDLPERRTWSLTLCLPPPPPHLYWRYHLVWWLPASCLFSALCSSADLSPSLQGDGAAWPSYHRVSVHPSSPVLNFPAPPTPHHPPPPRCCLYTTHLSAHCPFLGAVSLELSQGQFSHFSFPLAPCLGDRPLAHIHPVMISHVFGWLFLSVSFKCPSRGITSIFTHRRHLIIVCCIKEWISRRGRQETGTWPAFTQWLWKAAAACRAGKTNSLHELLGYDLQPALRHPSFSEAQRGTCKSVDGSAAYKYQGAWRV